MEGNDPENGGGVFHASRGLAGIPGRRLLQENVHVVLFAVSNLRVIKAKG